MKRAAFLASMALAVLFVACSRESKDEAEQAPPSEPTEAASTASKSVEPQGQAAQEAFLREVLKTQLKSAAQKAREGKLESSIRQIEICQRLFPGLPELKTLHASLVKRREEAIRQQRKPPVMVLNRSQMAPADRVKFSLLMTEWNQLVGKTEKESAVGLRDRLASVIESYPDLVEARILQARMALWDDHAGDGQAAGKKLSGWKWDTRSDLPQNQRILVESLQAKGWYPRASPVPQSSQSDPPSPLDRIRTSLQSPPP